MLSHYMGNFIVSQIEFYQTVANEEEYLEWLADFINKQVPLGEEFEKVLRDNLWSLYE